jgi:hypothetical protein
VVSGTESEISFEISKRVFAELSGEEKTFY